METKKKILIIEDEKPLANILTKILIGEGLDVDIALDGQDGLTKVDSYKPDLILLDILLPKVNGLEFLKILREEKQRKDIPVIMLTNLESEESAKEASKYGANVYFVKANTSIDVLKSWISEVLKSNDKENIGTRVKSVQINAYGDSKVLQINEIDLPKPDAGQVLIEVHSASINPFDINLVSGIHKDTIPVKFPFTPGSDFSGIIVEAGAGVTNFKKGDEVFGSAGSLSGGSGSLAEMALAKSENIYLKPKNISFGEASALVLVGVSALMALEEHIKLQKEQKILIHGGAGGIGHVAIQLACAMGAHVATTVSTEDIEFATKLGARGVIDYKNQDFEKILKEYDAVYDTVGGETTNKSFSVLRKGGTLVSMLGEPDQKKAQELGVIAIGQSTKVNSDRLERLSKYIKRGELKVNIDREFSLMEVQKAFDYFTTSSPKGKVSIKIR